MKVAILATLLPALASAAAVAPVKANYDGYKVVRVKTSPKVNSIIRENNLPTWNGNPEKVQYSDVVLKPDFHGLDDFDTEIMHENLGASIKKEGDFGVYVAGTANDTWFNTYHSYADHLTFLRDLQASWPTNSEIFTVGNSLQGRPITGIRFWGSTGKGNRPAIVLHSTVHAREWITNMVTEYFAYQLITKYNTDATIRALVDKYDFQILPVVNPDGFVFSQTTTRLWRKNRQSTAGSTCLGHDINRNWPWKWEVPGGASTNPCAEDFKGTSPSDAPETTVLSAHLRNLGNSVQGLAMFIDYHAYSQLFMTPYGYSCTALPANNSKFQSLVQGAAAAIRAVYGTAFKTGPICSTIYQATGSSTDYVYDVAKARFAFTSELRDTGRYGFVLPADQIRPSGIEAFEGFKYLVNNI
jgi:murein tripeptide amidase MpaA